MSAAQTQAQPGQWPGRTSGGILPRTKDHMSGRLRLIHDHLAEALST